MKAVQRGKIPAGQWIKLAVQRHFDDLRRAKKRSFKYYFDEERAANAVQAFEFQRLAEGDLAGEPFELMPWQAWVLYLAYGWRRRDSGLRRFSKVYIKVARGNAKTEFLAGVGNLAFFFEGVRDPQIFWAATKKDQAKIGFGRQKAMAQRLMADFPEIRAIADASVSRVYQKPGYGMGFVTYLGRDSKTEDGWRPYYALIDEYHAHPDNKMMHVLESGMVKVASPMTWLITTAGHNPDGPCAVFEHETCKKVLLGVVDVPELLPIIYDLDEGDDWKDEKAWGKANPSLGVSININALRSEFQKALSEGIAKEYDFKTKNLNMWVRSSAGWITDDVWISCKAEFSEKDLEGRECYCALDLAYTSDFTAVALFFPSPDLDEEPHKIVWRYWVTEEAAKRQRLTDYYQWARDGLLTLVDGDTMDFDIVVADMIRLRERFNILSIGVDPWNAKQLQIDMLGEGFNISEFRQGFRSMSAPAKEFDRAVRQGDLGHTGDAVTRWMLGNVQLVVNTAGDIKLDKSTDAKNHRKIDGIVAAVMAYGEWLTHQTQPKYVKSYLFADE